MITVAWMMMQFQMNRCRISGLEESSLFQTCITVRDVNPQLIHCLMSSSLSNLMKIKMKKVNEISLAKAKLLPLEELGALVMKVGKHQGETYQEIFNDNGYLKWVAAHIPNNPKSGHDMKMFVVDMRRRLEGEIQGEDPTHEANLWGSHNLKLFVGEHNHEGEHENPGQFPSDLSSVGMSRQA